jgi:peptidoglycan/LPS O-acetylase OafA/YrhL
MKYNKNNMTNRLINSKLSFEFLRLVFALMVLISHLGSTSGLFKDWTLQMNNYLYSIGNFAVFGFFFVSGYVITASWLSDPRLLPFLQKRILRIYPAYWICLLIGTFIIAPFLYNNTTFQLQINYFIRNISAIFVTCNLTDFTVPGAKECINTPTWSLGFEILAYLGVAILGVLGLIKRKWFLILLYIGFLTLYYLRVNYPVYDKLFANFGGTWLQESFAFVVWFLSGSLYYNFRDKIQLRYSYFILTIILTLGSIGLGITRQFEMFYRFPQPFFNFIFDTFPFVGPITVGYIILFLANKLPTHSLKNKIGDISYGVYIYGWLCERVLAYYNVQFISMPLYIYSVITFALICGILSYQFIERPIMFRFRPKK